MPRFLLEGAQSFALRPHTMVELRNLKRFYWLVSWTQLKTYCVLCTVKAKKANKNMEQRTLSGFIT